VLGTAIAQVVWFRLLAGHGSARSTLVSYLLPAFALVYGAAFLSEPLDLAKVGGFALILLGVALAAGRVPTIATWRSRSVPPAPTTSTSSSSS
jgi:drug/metabolite transporter (DMT)-like permease